jgi:hypothetical protein
MDELIFPGAHSMLQQGSFVADVLYFYGEKTAILQLCSEINYLNIRTAIIMIL